MQVLVRAAFFLWLTVMNLVALSAVWARLADVFGSGASKRLFGFLGAGATCGNASLWQLQTSLLSYHDLYPAPGIVDCSSPSGKHLQHVTDVLAQDVHQSYADWAHVIMYIHMCPSQYTNILLYINDRGAQVWHHTFCQLKGCGAVPPGQLAGSLTATLFARLLKAGALHGLPAVGMQACPMVLSALLLEGAGQAVASLKPLHASPASKIPGSTRKVQRLTTCLLGYMLCWWLDMSLLKSTCCGLLHGGTAIRLIHRGPGLGGAQD